MHGAGCWRYLSESWPESVTAHGQTDLQTLLGSLQPELLDAPLVYLFWSGIADTDMASRALLMQPFAMVRETTGLCLVVDQAVAEQNSETYSGVFRAICLKVYSSLQAVGLTAAVSAALAEKGIAANMIASFHHDYLLVPQGQECEALHTLQSLQKIYASS